MPTFLSASVRALATFARVKQAQKVADQGEPDTAGITHRLKAVVGGLREISCLEGTAVSSAAAALIQDGLGPYMVPSSKPRTTDGGLSFDVWKPDGPNVTAHRIKTPLDGDGRALLAADPIGSTRFLVGAHAAMLGHRDPTAKGDSMMLLGRAVCSALDRAEQRTIAQAGPESVSIPFEHGTLQGRAEPRPTNVTQHRQWSTIENWTPSKDLIAPPTRDLDPDRDRRPGFPTSTAEPPASLDPPLAAPRTSDTIDVGDPQDDRSARVARARQRAQEIASRNLRGHTADQKALESRRSKPSLPQASGRRETDNRQR